MNNITFDLDLAIGKLLAQNLSLGVLIVDRDCRITRWNSWLEKHSGLAQNEMLGKNLLEMFPAIGQRRKDKLVLQCLTKGIPTLLSAYLHRFLIPLDIFKNGLRRRMLQNVKIYPLKADEQLQGAVIIISDVTEAILHERELLNVHRLLAGIRNINRMMVRVNSEDDLCAGICRILTDEIGFACCWMGRITPDSPVIQPVHVSGVDPAQVAGQQFIRDDSPLGDSAVARAARSQTVQVVNDIAQDARCAPWWEWTKQIDCRSVCALPLKLDQQVFAVLAVYARDIHFFNDDILQLLNEIVDDMVFGITALRERTRRKATERALAAEKEQLFTTLNSIGDGVIATDCDSRIVSMNPIAENMSGWTLAEAKGRPLKDVFRIVNEITHQPVPNVAERVLRSGQVIGLANHTLLVSRDGRYLPIKDSAAPIIMPHGDIIGVVIVFQDDTQQRLAQRTLQESEEKYRAMVEHSTDHIFMLSLDEIYLASNGHLEPFGSTDSNGPVGLSLKAVYPPDAYACYHAHVESVQSIGKPVSFEYKHTMPGGASYYRHTLFPILREKRMWAIGGVSRNTTERKKMENRIIQSQKMEAIGTLAGGIAHDFNNILSAILGYAELSMDDARPDSMQMDNLSEIYVAGKRAAELVQQILTFSRRTDKALQPVQPALIAREVLKLLSATLPATIEIVPRIHSRSVILGDPTQVHQIVTNLCTNAAYAMETTGGTLTVELTDQALDRPSGDDSLSLPSGDYIRLKVQDTGTGIAPEVLPSIFEPYFTTKPEGEGTGLGMAVVHGIVKEYGGEIVVQSEPGQGACVCVYLPILAQQLTHDIPQSRMLPTGHERILLVDDEKPIIQLHQRSLKRLGYTVEALTSSLDALELFQKQPEAFDLVISDVSMPKLAGDKLAIEMMKIRPDIPIILCTGYSRMLSEKRALQIGIKALEMKPLKRETLADTVRRVLDQAK